MMRKGFVFFLLLGLWNPLPLMAEALVLIQGHLSHDDSWRRSGVAMALVSSGWQDGGHLHSEPQGVMLYGPPRQGERQFYTLTLDSSAPLLIQQHQLLPYIHYLAARHAGEPLHLAGHSAGGVVARLFMVSQPEISIHTLISLASPHLGTGLAEVGRMIGQSPLGWVTPWLGANEIHRAQVLYHDLSREQPGNLLYWLNRQPHPEAHYVSLLRDSDALIPLWSQDMNRVPALQGRASMRVLPGGHNLHPADGHILAETLHQIGRTTPSPSPTTP